MRRLRLPLLLSASLVGVTFGLGCGSTPRDQNYGTLDGSDFEIPVRETSPDTTGSDASAAAGGASGAGGDTSGAGGAGGDTSGAAGATAGAGGSSDAASDAISDAGADG